MVKGLLWILILTSILIISISNVKAESSSCQAMADKLNKRWMVGANRFDAGNATGEEARELLMKWIGKHGLLTTICTPRGYPYVSACFDTFEMDHVAASWVGLTDQSLNLVQSGQLQPFPVYPMPGIGLVYNLSSPRVKILCAYASDAASAFRMKDEEGNPGCGPLKSDYYFGIDSKRPIIEQYLQDMRKNRKNMTNLALVSKIVGEYNRSVSTWDLKDWSKTGRTWKDFDCNEWYNETSDWTAFTPANTSSMDACKVYIQDPSNLWNPKVTKLGNAFYFKKMGSWKDVYKPLLGHPTCKERNARCVSLCKCPGWSVEWMGACSWPAESFQVAMDMWLSLRNKANRDMMQQNELSLNLAADGPGGVEAIYVYDENTLLGEQKLQSYLEHLMPGDYPYPKNATQYFDYAAKQMAKEFYGDIPVLKLNPTKENALAGTLFSCDTQS